MERVTVSKPRPQGDQGAAEAGECPACGGGSFARVVAAPGLAERRCRGCGLLVGELTPRGQVQPEFARVNEDGYLRSVGTARRRQAGPILDLIAQHVRPGSSVLDVGCSFGFFLHAARERGYHVQGIEPDAQAWAYAERLLGTGTVTKGWFTGHTAKADVLVTLDVLEHIPVTEHAAFASSVHDSLRAGGLWVIKVPSSEGLYYRLSRLAARAVPRIGEPLIRRMWQTEYEYPHLVYFHRKALDLWLRSHSFLPVASTFLPEIPPGTVLDRLTTDGAISRPAACALAPAVYAITALDRLRGRTDALVTVARPA
jgi:SAM-dependent methyltransferase